MTTNVLEVPATHPCEAALEAFKGVRLAAMLLADHSDKEPVLGALAMELMRMSSVLEIVGYSLRDNNAAAC